MRAWIIDASLIGLMLLFSVGIPNTHAHKLNPELIERLTGEQVTQEEGPAKAAVDPRGEERTFASFPEWYVVFSAQEYGAFVARGGRPSQFPYFQASKQYWESVRLMSAASPMKIDSKTQTVLQFIGVSFTAENILLGAYEKTFGRLFEWTNGFHKTTEDLYTDTVATEYGNFLPHDAWYEFPYYEKLVGLWRAWGTDSFTQPRSIERRTVFTFGYLLKGIYGKMTKTAAQSTFGEGSFETESVVTGISKEALETITGVRNVETREDGYFLVHAGRYDAFTPVVQAIAKQGGTFATIQGNDMIMVTVVAPTNEACVTERKERAFSLPVLTQPLWSRFALSVPVTELGNLTRDLDACHFPIEHVYDY